MCRREFAGVETTVEGVENLFIGRVAEQEAVVFKVIDDEGRYRGGVDYVVAIVILAFHVKGLGAMCEEEFDEFLLLVEADGGGRILRDIDWLLLIVGRIGLIGRIGQI